MNPQPFDTARTTEPSDGRALARMIAEELAFALSTQNLKVRQTNVPVTQKVEGEVIAGVRGMQELLDRVNALSDVIAQSKTVFPEVVRVEQTNLPEPTVIPEYPKEISATLKELPDIKSYLASIEKAVKEQSTTVEVKAPDVHVAPTNLFPLQNGLIDLQKLLKEAVKGLGRIEDKEAPITDIKPLEKVMKAVLHSLDTLQFPSPQRLQTDNYNNVNTVSQNRLVTKPYNGIIPSYPTATSEAYAYQLNGTTHTTVTVNYTDSTKTVLGPITVT